MTRSHSPAFLPSVPLALAIGSIAFAQPALAEDSAAPPPSTLLATVPEPTTTTAAAVPEDTAVTATAPDVVTAPRYPRQVIARPLTLPAGVAMLGADAVANSDVSAIGGAPIVGYGITDKLEVQVPYAFSANEFEPRGNLGVDVGYVIVRGAVDGKLEAIARMRTGYNTLDSAMLPLQLGVHVQYNVKPWLALISGVPGAQQFRISVEEDAEMAKPVDIGLPLGVGVQPTGELYLQLDTKLASIGLSDSEHALIGKDATPVALTVIYNVIQALDLQAAIGTDLTNSPGDALSFLVGARFYAGQL